MVRLSDKTIKLLKDDINSILYENPLKGMFTNDIAKELRRDKEFTKKLLLELKKQGLVEEVKKNNRGKNYVKRKRWIIPTRILKLYEKQNQ